MISSKKQRRANRKPQVQTQKASSLALPRLEIRWQRTFLTGMAGLLVILTLLVAMSHTPHLVRETSTVEPPAKPIEPFDITLSATDVASPEGIDQVATLLPSATKKKAAPIPVQKAPVVQKVLPVQEKTMSVQEKPMPIQKPLPAAMHVSVVPDVIAPVANEDPEDQAERLAGVAGKYLRANDIKMAIQSQHRAVELDPTNMAYRLDLAVMYDRVADKEGAAALYRQVIKAYENEDETLPVDLAIDDIRQRLKYLTLKTPQ